MKLAFSTLGCPGWTVEQAVQAALAYGYAAIEWRLADGELITSQTNPEVKARIKQAHRASGLEIACLDTSCRFVQATAEQRQETIAEAKALVDLALELEAPLLRVFGGAIPANLSREELIQPTSEALHEVARYAASEGVKVLLETHDDWSKSKEALALLGASSPSKTDLNQNSNPAESSLAILWDAHHPYRMGEAPHETLANLQPLLAHVHIKDARRDPFNKDGWQLTLLEEGEVPVREIVRLLKEAGYQGYLSVEWEKKWHPEIEEPEIALPQYAKLLQSYLAALE